MIFFSRQYQELELNLNSWKQTTGPFPNRQWIAMLRFVVAKAPIFCSSPKLGEAYTIRCGRYCAVLSFRRCEKN